MKKLKERADTGDETANQLLTQTSKNLSPEQIQTYSAKSYAGCILADTFGVQIALLNGDLVDTLVGYIQDQWWQAAAELIIIDVLGKSVSNRNIAENLILNTVLKSVIEYRNSIRYTSL